MEPIGKSSALRPDLDWSQVRETVLMLEVAAGQVDAAMKESGRSVSVLIESFTSLVELVDSLEKEAADLPAGPARDSMVSKAGEIATRVQSAVIAFQFYDRLSQRLDHVCEGLDGLSDLVADRSKIFNPTEWANLQQNIMSRYTMESEREMFQKVLAGMSVDEALHEFMESGKDSDSGEIELF